MQDSGLNPAIHADVRAVRPFASWRVVLSRSPRAGAAIAPSRAEVTRLVLQAHEAVARLPHDGHAATERRLREACAAIERRGDGAGGAAVRLLLGRLLLARGRATEALRAFETARATAQAAGAADASLQAAGWSAWALIDLARLTAAETACREAAGDRAYATDARQRAGRAWVSAVWVRVLLWQGRASEALVHDLCHDEPAADPEVAALVAAVDVQRHLRVGLVFEAGVRARAAAAVAARAGNRVAEAVCAVSLLRVVAATGDLALGSQAHDAAVAAGRAARLPLWTLRARLAWADMLARAGRRSEARAVRARAHRSTLAWPPLWRDAIAACLGGVGSTPGAGADGREGDAPDTRGAGGVSAWRVAADLVTATQVAGTAPLGELLARAGLASGALSLQVLGPDGLVVGQSGVGGIDARELGARVLERGTAVLDACGGQGGVPVRDRGRLIGALVARWGVAPTGAGGERLEALTLAASALSAAVAEAVAQSALRAGLPRLVPELVGCSDALAGVRDAIVRAARAPFAVLVEGESGCGKELVARAIHRLGPRASARFCDLNCAALPDELVEAELFGHARGAFTGAAVDRPGLFEEASGGTLFLDEVVDLSVRAQAKLLRVLQQQEVRRVGETASRRVDVRVISAANRDMRVTAAQGRFREDLLYRLDVVRIRVPPLRERPEDIEALARHFWLAACRAVGTEARLTMDVIDAFRRYGWPGNVRELQNVVAALAVAAPSRGVVTPALLPPQLVGPATDGPLPLARARDAFERRFVMQALARAGGRQSQAARALGLSRQGLAKLLRRLELAHVDEGGAPQQPAPMGGSQDRA